uniref:Ig-like domain-containing protein n=1 Tax=Lates calcarifer TaxID=8187 RepID=A0A4W6BP26_LATCA
LFDLELIYPQRYLHAPHVFTFNLVSCVFMESCILPCSFQSRADPVIHWVLVAGNIPVHSFYFNQDQLRHQNQYFRGRTSLFKDQISRGNASLQLTGVEVQDQGKYRCYTMISYPHAASTSSFLAAPVSKVNMEQVGNRIICSSEGIYPKPDLTWSTRPPSNLTLQNQTSIQQTEQQLYNISSSLILSDSETDLIYICTISTRSNSRRVTLFKPTAVAVVFLVLHCKKKRGKITFCLNFLIHFLFFVLMMMFLLSGRQRTNRRESKDDEIQT